MTNENNNESRSVPLSADAITLAEGLLNSAKKAEVKKLDSSEKEFLKENNMHKANFYKLVATIDLAHNDNVAFRQGIMLLIDALARTEKEDHPEIIVAGEDEEHAEVQLVAERRESLENLHYEDARKFLAETRKRIAA